MKQGNQQFKIQLICRNNRPSKRKFSADYRYRQKIKQRNYTPLSHHDIKQTITYEKQKTGCLNTIFQKQLQSKSFAEKCVNLLSKKKVVREETKKGEVDEAKKRNREDQSKKEGKFNSMLHSIKNNFKQEKIRGRENRYDSQPLVNNEFQCVRSQIHQIYSNEEKMQLYRMIKNCQAKDTHRRELAKQERIDKNSEESEPSKPLINPFINLNTIVCFTLPLNSHQPKKQSLFEVPLGRTSFSACTKRRINISKPSSIKPMSFHLNDDNDGQYSKKLKSFFDFLFKLNFSNGIYVNLQLNKPQQVVNIVKYKAYIGRGNNSLLIKSLMKRRFWWQITDSIQSTNIHLYWSQNIIDKIESKQMKAKRGGKQINRGPSKKNSNEQLLDINRKILSQQKCKKINNFITKDGFIIPFDQEYTPDIITNHIPRNYCIGSKKNLFKSLFHYFQEVKHKDPFQYIPKTYHITSTQDKDFALFLRENQTNRDKVWIVKPGQNSNQGRGIKLATTSDIHKLVSKHKHQNGMQKTFIIQSYLNRPFLYNGRKFDLRHFMLITSINDQIKAYWYKDGYVRTSSQLFDIEDLDNEFIHLTNDAIQRNSQEYQRYQQANKLSYSQLQRFLDYSYPSKNYSLQKDILPKLKEMACSIVKANYQILDHKRHQNNFQIFGLDFMIDRDFKPWLIEVNYNPCLQVNCPVLERIIPVMLQHSLRIGLDPLFPPTAHYPVNKRFNLSDNYLKNLKYEMIFDQDSLRSPINNNFNFIDEKQKQEQYQDDGEQLGSLVV